MSGDKEVVPGLALGRQVSLGCQGARLVAGVHDMPPAVCLHWQHILRTQPPEQRAQTRSVGMGRRDSLTWMMQLR